MSFLSRIPGMETFDLWSQWECLLPGPDLFAGTDTAQMMAAFEVASHPVIEATIPLVAPEFDAPFTPSVRLLDTDWRDT